MCIHKHSTVSVRPTTGNCSPSAPDESGRRFFPFPACAMGGTHTLSCFSPTLKWGGVVAGQSLRLPFNPQHAPTHTHALPPTANYIPILCYFVNKHFIRVAVAVVGRYLERGDYERMTMMTTGRCYFEMHVYAIKIMG